MGVNTVPRFIEQPQTWKTQVNTGNLNLGGNTGALATLVTGADPHGSKIDYFWFQAQALTEANTLRLYLFTSGGTPSLLREVLVSGYTTAGVGTVGWSGSFTPATPIVVPGGWTLQCSIATPNVINIFGFGGDY